MPQTIFVSATPAKYEGEHAGQVAEQVVRPTGLVGLQIITCPVTTQVDDLMSEINGRIQKGERVLVTILAKRMAEQLTDYYSRLGIKVRYLYNDIGTVERVEVIRGLRLSLFDIFVGINLLCEGLDIPEVSLVAILDADEEGFLRSHHSLIQTMGRAVHNVNGVAILYADKIVDPIKAVINETERRHEKRIKLNEEHGVMPQQVKKQIKNIIDGVYHEEDSGRGRLKGKNKVKVGEIHNKEDAIKEITKPEKAIQQAARGLRFEEAAVLRDRIRGIEESLLFGAE